MVRFADPVKKICFVIVGILNIVLPSIKRNNVDIPEDVVLASNIGASVCLGVAIYADALEKKINDLIEGNKKMNENIEVITSVRGTDISPSIQLTARTDTTQVPITSESTVPYPEEPADEVFNAYYCKRTNQYKLTPRNPEQINK